MAQSEPRKYRFITLDEARQFIKALPLPTRKKVYYNIRRIINGDRDVEIFKKLVGTDIWEIRTLYDGMACRLFAFWDKDAETVVVATHGIIKKTASFIPRGG